jgi:hypothetical protein
VTRVSLKRERYRCKGLPFRVRAGRGTAAVDVKGWYAEMPVPGLVVVEQLHPQIHAVIVSQDALLIRGIPFVMK